MNCDELRAQLAAEEEMLENFGAFIEGAAPTPENEEPLRSARNSRAAAFQAIARLKQRLIEEGC